MAGKYKKFNADYDDWFYFVEDTAWPELHRQVARPHHFPHHQQSRSLGGRSLDQIDSTTTTTTTRYNKSLLLEKLRRFGGGGRKEKCVECRSDKNGFMPRIRFSKVLDVRHLPPVEVIENRSSSLLPKIDPKEKVAKYLKDLARNDIEADLPPQVEIVPLSGPGFKFSHDDARDDGPSHWHELFAQCGGQSQSPVALTDTDGILVPDYEPFAISGMYNRPLSIRLQNDGHSAKYSFQFKEGETPRITGGPLCCSFRMDHFHFHWGSTDT